MDPQAHGGLLEKLGIDPQDLLGSLAIWRGARPLQGCGQAQTLIWNVAFFGRRSPRDGFLGVLLFLGPLLSLQKAVSHDPVSWSR